MNNPHTETQEAQELPSAQEMLRRIGWQPSDMALIRVYARMSPAQKIKRMLRRRTAYIRMLKARLKRENPDQDQMQLAYLLQEHLDLEREYPYVMGDKHER